MISVHVYLSAIYEQLEVKFREYESSFSSKGEALDFPAKALCGIMENHLASIPEKDRLSVERVVEPLVSLAKSYEGGREGHACTIVQSLFSKYLLVEELFSEKSQVFLQLLNPT
jgi:acetyl-CoA carboxylase/biotin carboxylase 1